MNRLAKNYADALFLLARDEGVADEILTQFAQVRKLFDENPDYVRFLFAPNIPKEERTGALDEAFSGRIHAYLLNFLKLLSEHGHIFFYQDCELRYRTFYNLVNDRIEAKVFTALPLRPDQLQRLKQRLCELTGKQVDLQNRVDPTVLGGIRLQYDEHELDGTVRQRLRAVEKTLSETVI